MEVTVSSSHILTIYALWSLASKLYLDLRVSLMVFAQDTLLWMVNFHVTLFFNNSKHGQVIEQINNLYFDNKFLMCAPKCNLALVNLMQDTHFHIGVLIHLESFRAWSRYKAKKKLLKIKCCILIIYFKVSLDFEDRQCSFTQSHIGEVTFVPISADFEVTVSTSYILAIKHLLTLNQCLLGATNPFI